MKQTSLIAIIIVAMVMASCGKKEEKKEDLANKDNAIIDESLDSSQNIASYEDYIANGSEDGITPVDSTKKTDMVYISPENEVQIDPPVDNSKNVKKEVIKEPKKEVKKEPIKEVKKEPVKEKVIVKETTKNHELRYYIVVGSFKKYSNAQNLNTYFTKKGYTPLILPKADGYNRVAVSSFSQETEARTAIKKLRVEHNDLTFWLYKW